MNSFLGDKEVNKIYFGSKEIDKLYLGSELIFSSSLPPNPSEVVTSKYTNLEDGKLKTIYWVKGITPPKVGTNLTKESGSDFTRLYISSSGDVTYDCPYLPGNGWYDSKKSPIEPMDDNLCFMAVAVNALWWWIDRNREEIDKYLKINKDSNDPAFVKFKELLESPRSQLNSSIWIHYLTKMGLRNDGYWPDAIIDNFLNGYRFKVDIDEAYANDENDETGEDGQYLLDNGPDNTGNHTGKPLCGFLYDVFSIHRLTDRTIINPTTALGIDKIIKDSIINGEQLGIVYFAKPNTYGTHIVSIWGAEYNTDNTLSALFICDNNDEATTPSNPGVSMKRVMVNKRGGLVYLTSKIDGSGGSSVTTLTHTRVNKDYWNEYFETHKESKYPCTGVSIDKFLIRFADYNPIQLNAIVTPENCDEEIRWESDHPGIADVDKTGLVSPKKTGRCIIKVTCGKFENTCDAVVTLPIPKYPCTGVSFDTYSIKFIDTKPRSILVSTQPWNCDDKLFWKSSNPEVATVDKAVITPHKSGHTDIIATCGEYNAVCNVTVDLPKPGTEGCKYFNPIITMVGVKARLQQDGHEERFDVSYTLNSGHPDYYGNKIIQSDGETYYLSILSKGSSEFAVNNNKPDSGAWTSDYGFGRYSIMGFKENPIDSLDCGVTNLNNSVNLNLISMGFPLVNQSFDGLNIHLASQSLNTMDVGTYSDSFLGLNEMSADHMKVHFNGPGMNKSYGGVTDQRFPCKNGINRSWLSTFVHEFGHCFGVPDEAPHKPSMYDYNRDRNKCLYLQPNDLKYIQDHVLTDWGVFLKRAQDINFDSRLITPTGEINPVINEYNLDYDKSLLSKKKKKIMKGKTELYFDYDNDDDIDLKADVVVECNLIYSEMRILDVGNGLQLIYNIYDIINESIIRGNLKTKKLKIHIGNNMKISSNSRYRLLLDQYIDQPSSLINPRTGIIEIK